MSRGYNNTIVAVEVWKVCADVRHTGGYPTEPRAVCSGAVWELVCRSRNEVWSQPGLFSRASAAPAIPARCRVSGRLSALIVEKKPEYVFGKGNAAGHVTDVVPADQGLYKPNFPPCLGSLLLYLV